ncbi:hypothetical protein BpHYR1_008617 [Brachionus plicatilis]|uniref:Uncharacterized protein n=1 Tax=Brachionus plicatilis TaxID=10195 RepID=A0A3M7S9F7_BRAPC|nr:hypothetical protein BpHYR1_008617 [Brachionus plicatilis]
MKKLRAVDNERVFIAEYSFVSFTILGEYSALLCPFNFFSRYLLITNPELNSLILTLLFYLIRLKGQIVGLLKSVDKKQNEVAKLLSVSSNWVSSAKKRYSETGVRINFYIKKILMSGKN